MNIPVSVWTGFFGDISPEAAVDELTNAGFTHAEFSLEHGRVLLQRPGTPEEEGRALKEYAAKKGLTFLQGHLDLSLDLCRDVEALKRWLDLFCALGIRAAVLHANGAEDLPYEDQLKVRAAALRQLSDHIAGRDITICVENLFSIDMVRTADSILELVDAAGGRQLGVCMDIGHLHRARSHGKTDQTFRQFITKAGSRLKALHVHTNNGDLDDHLLPFSGMNGLDWKQTMTALRDIGYQDLFNMELNGEAEAPLAVRRMKLRYAKQLAEYLLSDEFLDT